MDQNLLEKGVELEPEGMQVDLGWAFCLARAREKRRYGGGLHRSWKKSSMTTAYSQKTSKRLMWLEWEFAGLSIAGDCPWLPCLGKGI